MGSAKIAADFIHDQAPPLVDAEKTWHDAFEEARRTDRKVWVRVSQRYCGPCFTLARWLDDQSELLSQDYVMLKIDDFHDLHGDDFAERLTQGERHGIPFHAIFDEHEDLLIDSTGPLGNVGSFGGYEGKIHLRRMLTSTRQNLTDDEIEQLVGSVPD